MKVVNSKFLIKVKGLKSIPTVFIDEVILEGRKDELCQKLTTMDYIRSLGIHESFYFAQFVLVLESSVDFPE